MKQAEGRQWMEELKKRWIAFSLIRVFILSLAVALVIAGLLFHFFQLGLIAAWLLPFVAIFSILSFQQKYWQISISSVSRFIDLHFPEVEESSGLLLKPAGDLSFLEQLQLRKVTQVLSKKEMPHAPLLQLKAPAVLLLLSMIVCFFLLRIPAKTVFSTAQTNPVKTQNAKLKENIPPQISSFTVQIVPPAYTGAATRTQKQFTVLAEIGAAIHWEIHTSQPIQTLSLRLNDKETVPLRALNPAKTSWSLSRVISSPGFYQVVMDGKKSDFYQIEIIPDQPVSIRIIKPAQHITIDVGQAQVLNLSVLMNDDYGIADAYISATMASGKGEAVSFKEKKLLFNMQFNHKTQIKVDKTISLKDLGMKPGDELYYYVNAKDNHGQQSRSDMFFVSIQDTTELMSMAGIDNGVSLVPEYFRSERQLIIDTEKLLKEKASITETEFKSRSNDLGVDQKMLRLRYGKFLGEESETNIGAAHDDDHDHKGGEPEKFGGVQGIMDQYAHKHDNAEDATFFEPALKAQLKATLTEMWGAELRLRTYVPQEALLFEYKALRLLKDLQQKSRAYVAKATLKTSPLKPEKRLTGELDKIKTGVSKSNFEPKGNRSVVLQSALGVLENLKDSKGFSAENKSVLLQAEHELINAAAVDPRNYLAAVKALKKIIATSETVKINRSDLAYAEKGINLLIGNVAVSPQQKTDNSSSALAKSYFNHLTRSAQ